MKQTSRIQQRNKDRNLGLSTLNGHHQEIFKMINKISTSIDQDSEGPFKFYVNELLDYITKYFKSQEAMMIRSKYPRLEEHRKEHNYFSKSFHELLFSIHEKGITDRNVFSTKQLVGELANHIMISDHDIPVVF